MKNKRVTEHCSIELLIGDHNEHEQKRRCVRVRASEEMTRERKVKKGKKERRDLGR